ncbi:MAG: WecB/TagA/CpsF family glycosyltransferase [Acidimicrobiales bacterium]|nr:WecB/TagA/CpsF family glycosyltransferase [Acidimicrobiales bacterium]
MTDLGKHNVLGIRVDAVDYAAAIAYIREAALEHRPFGVSALAVHGVMTGVDDDEHRYRLNGLDLVTPDGQPVRWALRLLHGIRLDDRVYGPELTLRTCAMAAENGLSVYLYGSTEDVLERLSKNLPARFPGLEIAGAEPSKFRTTSQAEKYEIARRIQDSGADIVLVGLGCPRQEIFTYEYRNLVSMPMLAVGAAFDYHAGLLAEPPQWVQRAGLQWLFRLGQDPRRLWRRYTIVNIRYVMRIVGQKSRIRRPNPDSAVAPRAEILPG